MMKQWIISRDSPKCSNAYGKLPETTNSYLVRDKGIVQPLLNIAKARVSKIAGTLVFTVFNRDALIEEFKEKLNGDKLGIQKFKAEGSRDILSIEEWDAQMSGYASPNADPTDGKTGGKVSDLVGKYQPIYADEILPFDITVSFAM